MTTLEWQCPRLHAVAACTTPPGRSLSCGVARWVPGELVAIVIEKLSEDTQTYTKGASKKLTEPFCLRHA